MRRRLPFALAVLGLALVACGDPDRTETPRIVVSPTSLIFNSVPLGGQDVLELMVENEGRATLRVSELRIEADTDFVTLANPDQAPFTVEPGEAVFVGLVYEPTAPDETDGNLILVTNDPQSREVAVPIDTPRPTPAAVVIPAVLDFGVVGVGEEATIDVEVRNVGLAPLIVCDALVTGNAEIDSDLDDALDAIPTRAGGHAVIDLYDFPTGAGVESLDFRLFYEPAAPGDDLAQLVLSYDDLGDLETPCLDENVLQVTFQIRGRAGTALLDRDPCPLDFGERAVDVTHEEAITLTNLGELPLQVFDISLDPDRTSPAFTLADVPDVPFALEPDAGAAFSVEYHPDELIAEAGVVLIEHTDVGGDRVTSECRLAGVGVVNDCPVPSPIAWILEDTANRRGTEVDWALPLQTLILDGTASYDPAGDAIVDYIWEVEQAPDAAINSIRPYSGDPTNPAMAEYFLPLAGQYRICLSVVDSAGLECESACVSVAAIPDEALAIELTWNNPADPDQTDAEGADVDLHFVKMPAAWGDPLYDTFYANKEPFWDPENPSLDIDDTDGVGPETIQMDDPEDCQWYAVGAHYFRETYGDAWPTVKIYIDGRLVDEIVNQPLTETDVFWDVARIHWPSRTIYRVNQVIEGYQNGAGFVPAVTEAMTNSGLCGLP